MVETDSKIVADWVTKGAYTLWWLWDFWEEIMDLIRTLNAQVRHVFREANMAANALAKIASDGSPIPRFYGDNVPTFLSGILCTDRWEIPNMRR